MKYKINIREEIFGATYYDIELHKRYYITKNELKDILGKNIFPKEITNKKYKKEEIKFTPIKEKIESINKFTFADIAFLELTRACNLRCKHCLNNSGLKMNNQLTKEEIINLIDNLANAGIQEIRYTGGEPLLCPFLDELIEYTTKRGLTTSIGTNGVLATKKIVNKLKKAGLKKCVVSVDGTEEKHNKIRGEGTYAKTMRGIKNLLDAGIDVRINSVIMKNNMKDVIEFSKQMNKEKRKLFIRRFIESGRGENLIDNSLSYEDYEYVRQELKEELNDKYIDGHYLHDNSGGFHSRIKIPFEVTGCRAGQRSFAIMPNGNIYPCGFLAAQGYEKVGNIREINNWREFWNNLQVNNKLVNIRKKMNDYISEMDKGKATCLAYVYQVIKKEAGD